MIENIIVVLGLVLFVLALFDKFYVWDKIGEFGAKSGIKIVYQLSQCQFCLIFHVSWIITLIYLSITGLNLGIFVIPFVVSGIITLKNV